ncbi:MAG: InlB B-repeat-containing protein, partial [Chloroflexi bacterium]|nr:InlB B-repeat-containing protein [Chloroflexota bacterium]
LTVSTVGQGAVDIDPDQAAYAYGDEVALTALPEPGWTFVGWSGDASGTTNPLTVTISGDTDITATFALAVEEPENPVPILTSLDPSEAVIGDPGFSLKVMGTGFVTGATVHWDGSPKNTTFISSEELLADITADDLTTERTVEVTVVNPGPGGGESGPLPFEVLEVHTGPGPEIVLCLPLILN